MNLNVIQYNTIHYTYVSLGFFVTVVGKFQLFLCEELLCHASNSEQNNEYSRKAL